MSEPPRKPDDAETPDDAGETARSTNDRVNLSSDDENDARQREQARASRAESSGDDDKVAPQADATDDDNPVSQAESSGDDDKVAPRADAPNAVSKERRRRPKRKTSTPLAESDEDVAVTREERDARDTRRGSTTEPPTQLGTIAHLAFVIAAAVGVYSFISVAKEGELRRRCSPTCILRPNYSGYEKRAPSFTLKDTQGRDVTLESYRGKVVVLNFWTKTCEPCMQEMPEIADLARIVRPMKDVAVLTISTDETAAEATEALKLVLKGEAPFPVLMDPETRVVREKFGTSLYPETWIIDKDGVIRARFDGQREWSNATVVEFVNQIRSGGYCPAEAREGKFVGETARLCDSLSGGG